MELSIRENWEVQAPESCKDLQVKIFDNIYHHRTKIWNTNCVLTSHLLQSIYLDNNNEGGVPTYSLGE